MRREQPAQRRRIADVGGDDRQAARRRDLPGLAGRSTPAGERRGRDRRERTEAQRDDVVAAAERLLDDVQTDEPGRPGHQDPHAIIASSCPS